MIHELKTFGRQESYLFKMLRAESVTIPLMCEQTKCFGSEGTIHYVMTPWWLYQPSTFCR